MLKLLPSRRLLPPSAFFSNPSSHLFRRDAACRSFHSKMESEYYTFGPYKIREKEVFYSTALSFAMVNLKPVVPGMPPLSLISFLTVRSYPSIFCRAVSMHPSHVYDMREVKRFVDLTAEETSDLWLTAKNVGSQIEHHYKASSLTFTIQDGPQAGQTVPHVHIHILPRKIGDFENNDEIYDAVDAKEKELKEKLNLDKERKDRSSEEMAEEADELRKLFT